MNEGKFEFATWADAKREWGEFLEEVEAARAKLNCSFSNAWFRGQPKSSWLVRPSLMRLRSKRRDPEIQGKLNSLENRQKDDREALAGLQRKKTELDGLIRNCREEHDPAGLDRANAAAAAVREKIRLRKASLSESERQCCVLRSIGHGERDAFHDWAFRSGMNYHSSWECLAEMQHHNVPTRLLDWTESMAVGVYFALEFYRAAMDKEWKKFLTQSDVSSSALPLKVPKGVPTPCLWILNPYNLAGKASGEKSIVNPTLDPRMDYFDSFFIHQNWRYEHPIPIFSPWKNHRIAAQGGLFTVWGLCRASLDVQMMNTDDIIEKVRISPLAAVYGVRFLREFAGMSEFTVFRDLDSLGTRVRDKFIDPKLRFR
jgi:hypothetical protein